MTFDAVNILMIVVLCGFIVALGFLIALLYRANRLLGKLDNLSDTFKSFVKDIVPAIVNIGTISTALHGVLRILTEKGEDSANSQKHHK